MALTYDQLSDERKKLLEIMKDAVVFGYHSNECGSMQPDRDLDVPDAWGKCDCWLSQAATIVYQAPAPIFTSAPAEHLHADPASCDRCKHSYGFHDNPSGICTRVECPCNEFVASK